MDVLTYLISRVKQEIPVQIIERVFNPREIRSVRTAPNLGFNIARSIEAAIHEKIIDGRVRPDLDIVGGTTLEIPLTQIPFETLDDPNAWEERFNVIYRIPKSYTNGREITSVQALMFGVNSQTGSSTYTQGAYPYGNGTGTVMQNQLQSMLSAVSPIAVTQSAQATVVGPNTILIMDWIPLLRTAYMKVTVGYDSHFTSIARAYWLPLSKLVVLATKAWIHTNYLLEMGENELRYGSELGDFRNIVDSYSEANVLYMEYLETQWKKKALLADTKAAFQHYKMLIPGGQ